MWGIGKHRITEDEAVGKVLREVLSEVLRERYCKRGTAREGALGRLLKYVLREVKREALTVDIGRWF